MKNILKIYLSLLKIGLSNGEISGGNIDKKHEMSYDEALIILEKNKDFAEFYEKTDSAKTIDSNKKVYKEYQDALKITQRYDVSNLSEKMISSAIDYNSRRPESSVSYASQLFGIENNGVISIDLIKKVVIFQRENGLDDDGKIGPATFNEIDKALQLKKSSESLKTTQGQTKLGIDNIKKSFDETTKEIVRKKDSGLDLSDDELLVLNSAVELAEKQLKDLDIANEKFSSDKKPLIEQTKQEINKVKSMILEESHTTAYKDKKTQQEVTKVSSDALFGLIKNGKFLTSDFIESLDGTSKMSLSKILSSSNLENIYNELESVSPEKGIFTDYIITDNYGEYAKKLKEIGYVKDGSLDDKEACGVLMILRDYIKTQNEVSNLTDLQKFQILIDFDSNGLLTIENNFNYGELQALHTMFGKQSDGIDVFMSNLGFGSMQEFSKRMTNNLFSAKEDFQRALGIMANSRISLVELSKKGGVEKGFSQVLSEQQTVTTEVTNIVDNSTELKTKLEALNLEEAQKNEIKKIIKLEAVAGVVNGSKLGTGVAFDISGYTANIIDSLGVGVYNGVPGITLSKEIFKGDNYGVSVGLVNMVIPILGANYTFDKSRLKSVGLKIEDIKNQTIPTVYGAVGEFGGFAGIQMSKNSEKTSMGIENMVRDLDESMKLIKVDILEGRSFEESSFYEKSTDKTSDNLIYTELKEVFEKYSTVVKDKLILVDLLLKGYKDFYKNKLHSNAEGINYSSVGAGVALVKGFLPLPFLTMSFDKIGIDYETVNDRLSSQRENMMELESIQKYGLEFTKLGDKNVYSLEDDGVIKFSNPTLDIQVHRENNKVYFSGDDLKTITISKYFGQKEEITQVVINGGSLGEKGEYKYSKESKITTSLENDTLSKQVIDFGRINELNKESLEKTESIRTDLFNILSKEALPHKNTPGLTKLQDMIAKMSGNEGVSLEESWGQFEKVFTNDKISKYAQEKNCENSLKLLQDKIGNGFSDGEKIIILQSVVACLMKHENIQLNAGDVKIGKSIASYDQRHKYFDKIFASETPDLLREVHSARNDWYSQNGDKSSYKFHKISEGSSIAFSGTEIKNGGRDILMPYMGAYNIANPGVERVVINEKSNDLIDLIPEQFLEVFRQNLSKKGYNIENNDVLISMLKGNKIDGVGIDYRLSFVKMGECLNDAIVIDDIVMTGVTSFDSSSSVNIGINKVTKIGIAFSGENRKKSSSNDSDGGTNPDPDPNPDPGNGGSTGSGNSNPGAGAGNNQNGSNGNSGAGTP